MKKTILYKLTLITNGYLYLGYEKYLKNLYDS